MSGSDGPYPYVGDDPGGVESAMTDLGGVGHALATVAGEVEHDTASIQQYWPQGHTGQVAAGDAARIGGALDECHLVFARAERALSELYPVLATGRRSVDGLNESYRVLAAAVHPFADWLSANAGAGAVLVAQQSAADELRVAQARSGFASLSDIDTAYQGVKTRVEEEIRCCNQILKQLTAEVDAPYGHAVGATKYDVSFGLLAARSAPLVADILSGRTLFPSDPAAVHEAWMLLSADQHAQLLAGDPARFGNLNGVPAADRDTANRLVLHIQLERLKAAVKAMGRNPTMNPKVLDGLSQGQIRTMGMVSGMSMGQAKQALLLYRQLQPGEGIKTQLLAYEPGAYEGKGRAAIAYGDVDSAANVAVCVPGLNTSLGNVDNVSSDAQALFTAAHGADPIKQTAVIAWQGYDAPGYLEVGSQDKADAGAKLLAADVNAMRVTHDGAIKGKLTVVGHSYGSTTTGLAFQRENMQADQGVLIGSPGAGGDAKTAADLHLDKKTLFVGSASRDVVTSVTRGFGHSLGADPSLDQFGQSATRFRAENVNRGAPRPRQRSGQPMSSPRIKAAAMVGVALLLLGATACQTSTPRPPGSTMQTQMSDLPDDPVAATALVRKMLMDEVIPLLKASGLKYTDAQFDVRLHTDEDTYTGDLGMGFNPCSDEQVQAMTDAIWANGWKQGSISHGLHVRKGPLDIQWGNGFGGCMFDMHADAVTQELEITDDVTRVPELAAFKAQP